VCACAGARLPVGSLGRGAPGRSATLHRGAGVASWGRGGDFGHLRSQAGDQPPARSGIYMGEFKSVHPETVPGASGGRGGCAGTAKGSSSIRVVGSTRGSRSFRR